VNELQLNVESQIALAAAQCRKFRISSMMSSPTGQRLLSAALTVKKIGTQDEYYLAPPVRDNKFIIRISAYGLEHDRINMHMIMAMEQIDVNHQMAATWTFLDDVAQAIPRSVRIMHRNTVLGYNLNDLIIAWVRRDTGVAVSYPVQRVLSFIRTAMEELARTPEPNYTYIGQMPLVLFVPTLPVATTINVPLFSYVNRNRTGATAPNISTVAVPGYKNSLLFIPGMARNACVVEAPGLSLDNYAWQYVDVQLLRMAAILRLGFFQSDLISYTSDFTGMNLRNHSMWNLTRLSPSQMYQRVYEEFFSPNKLSNSVGRMAMLDAVLGILTLRELLEHQIGDIATADWIMHQPEIINPIAVDTMVNFLYNANTPASQAVYSLMDVMLQEVDKFISFMIERIRKRRLNFVAKTPSGTDIIGTLENKGMNGAALLEFDYQPVRWASPLLSNPLARNFDAIVVEPWLVSNLGTPYFLLGNGQQIVPVARNVNSTYFTNQIQWSRETQVPVSVLMSHRLQKWKGGIKFEPSMKYYAPGVMDAQNVHILTSGETNKGYSWVVPAEFQPFLDMEVQASVGSIHLG